VGAVICGLSTYVDSQRYGAIILGVRVVCEDECCVLVRALCVRCVCVVAREGVGVSYLRG
jgi:hypothetical protein